MTLEGHTIETVRPMTEPEMERQFWDRRRGSVPPVIVLDDGTKIYPSRDPEGNGPGALFGTDSEGEDFMITVSQE